MYSLIFFILVVAVSGHEDMMMAEEIVGMNCRSNGTSHDGLYDIGSCQYECLTYDHNTVGCSGNGTRYCGATKCPEPSIKTPIHETLTKKVFTSLDTHNVTAQNYRLCLTSKVVTIDQVPLTDRTNCVGCSGVLVFQPNGQRKREAFCFGLLHRKPQLPAKPASFVLETYAHMRGKPHNETIVSEVVIGQLDGRFFANTTHIDRFEYVENLDKANATWPHNFVIRMK